MPNNSVAIRPLRWWDIEAVLDIEQSLFAADPWTAEMFWSELAQVPEGREVVVLEATSSHEILGYASLRFAGSDGDINTIAIAEQSQGKGLGRMLMDWLMARFTARQTENIFLEVRSDHSRAHDLYLKYGFEDIDIRKNYYGNEVDAVIMRRKVEA